MPEPASKLAILSALRREPDFSFLEALPAAESRQGRRLLRWLDQSGLALSLLHALKKFGATPRISAEWRSALGRRSARNLERTKDMFGEFCRLNAAFRERGLRVVTLKGFSLVPDFCEEASLRHQTDFDFLLHPADLAGAADALQSLGYCTPKLNESGETFFATPLRRIPSTHDDLYDLQQHRQADLHISLWEESPWLSLATPSDCVERAQFQTADGAQFLSLCLEDKFLLQVLHAFRHSLRSWVRLSWLLEIGRFLERREDNLELWNRVMERAGESPITKSAFATVLGLVNRLFHCALPGPLRAWIAGARSKPLETWLEHFGLEWALADWPGSLKNLFLAEEFIPDSALRRQYIWSRFVPRAAQMSVATASAREPAAYLELQLRRVQYVAERAFVHGKDLCEFPFQQHRWRRVLCEPARGEYAHNC